MPGNSLPNKDTTVVTICISCIKILNYKNGKITIQNERTHDYSERLPYILHVYFHEERSKDVLAFLIFTGILILTCAYFIKG
jgi:hypothetical protein